MHTGMRKSLAKGCDMCRQRNFSCWLSRWCCRVWTTATPRLPVYLATNSTRQTTVSSQSCHTSRVFGAEVRACHTVASGLALASCTSERRVHARLSLPARPGTWRPTTRGRSRIEATTSFVVIRRALLLYELVSAPLATARFRFSCSRLERTAGTRHIVAVVTRLQRPSEDS